MYVVAFISLLAKIFIPFKVGRNLFKATRCGEFTPRCFQEQDSKLNLPGFYLNRIIFSRLK